MSDNRGAYSTTVLPAGFVLFVVFLVLKLTHVIDWSWWAVTAPLWAVPALFLGLFSVFSILFLTYKGLDGIVQLIDKKHRAKRRRQKDAAAVHRALENYADALTRKR